MRVAGGSGTVADESRTIHDKLGPKMVTNWRGGGGKKASDSAVEGKGTTYERRYPACTEEPVRREGATGPERPKRMRPDGAVCYVEGKNGGLGVKRRHVQQGEPWADSPRKQRQTTRPTTVWRDTSEAGGIPAGSTCVL